MAGRPTFLVDTSALNRARVPAVRDRLARAAEDDALATCALIDLEVLYSARGLGDYEGAAAELAGLQEVPLDRDVFARARQVQHELARSGHHRLPVPDLVIAAAAELSGCTVLHYDADFQRIAAVTGQPHRWVVRRGSL